MIPRRALGGLLAVALPGANAASGAEPWQHRQVGGLTLHFAAIPAPGATRHLHDVVITVRDATGSGMDDTIVTATIAATLHAEVAELGLARRPGTFEWRGTAPLPPRDVYRIAVEVRRPGMPPASARFVHRQLQP